MATPHDQQTAPTTTEILPFLQKGFQNFVSGVWNQNYSEKPFPWGKVGWYTILRCHVGDWKFYFYECESGCTGGRLLFLKMSATLFSSGNNSENSTYHKSASCRHPDSITPFLWPLICSLLCLGGWCLTGQVAQLDQTFGVCCLDG
jgi:hypothetical protein